MKFQRYTVRQLTEAHVALLALSEADQPLRGPDILGAEGCFLSSLISPYRLLTIGGLPET